MVSVSFKLCAKKAMTRQRKEELLALPLQDKSKFWANVLVATVKNITENAANAQERVVAYNELLKSLGGTPWSSMSLPSGTRLVAFYEPITDLAYFFTVDKDKPFQEVVEYSVPLNAILAENPPDRDFWKSLVDKNDNIRQVRYIQDAPLEGIFGEVNGYIKLSSDTTICDFAFFNPYVQRTISSPMIEVQGLFCFPDIPTILDRAARVHDNFWNNQMDYPFSSPSILKGLAKKGRYGTDLGDNGKVYNMVVIRWQRGGRHVRPVKVLNIPT